MTIILTRRHALLKSAAVGVKLVGSAGAINATAVAASNSPAWGAGESRTAGNLLIAFASYANNAATTPSGWTLMQNAIGNNMKQALYYLIATGGDAAPTWPAGAGSIVTQLAEFTNTAATPNFNDGTLLNGTANPFTVTNNAGHDPSGIDRSFGYLVLSNSAIWLGTTQATAASHSMNNGATGVALGFATHAYQTNKITVSFAYGVTAGGGTPSVADSDTVTYTGGSGSVLETDACMASALHA